METDDHLKEQSIYMCDPERCSSRGMAQRVFYWRNVSLDIIGLHVAIDCGIVVHAILIENLSPILLLLLEMRSVERGICPIATSIMNELFQ